MKRYAYRLLLILILATCIGLIARFDPSGQVFNIPGLLIVIAGTFVATSLGQSFRTVIALLRQLPRKLAKEPLDHEVDIGLFLKASDYYRRANLRFAEIASKQIENPFLRSGAVLVLDRTPYHDVSRMLQWKIGAQRERDHGEIQIFLTMMSFAPAFGMIGTLFGLIAMLYGLDIDNLQHLGANMGFAMLTTIYGLLLANLVLKPVVSRLEQRSKERLAWLQVQYEAVLMMHEKCHPNLIRDYLDAFLDQPEPTPAMLKSLQLGEVKSTP